MLTKILLTTFAGISSIRSTVSSTNSSSSIPFNSESLKDLIKNSCCSLFISIKTSAACAFGRSLYKMGKSISGSSAKISAISTGLRAYNSGFKFANSFFSRDSNISTILSFLFSGVAFNRTCCTISCGILSKSSCTFSSKISSVTDCNFTSLKLLKKRVCISLESFTKSSAATSLSKQSKKISSSSSCNCSTRTTSSSMCKVSSRAAKSSLRLSCINCLIFSCMPYPPLYFIYL